MNPHAVLTLPRNTQGRDFIVGDIHGAYDLLRGCLKKAGFDPSKDRLISVGDLIDRGPRSPDCLWFLRQPWFFAVRGNHEQIFLGLDPDLKDGKTLKTIRNDFIGLKWVTSQPRETLDALRAAFGRLPLAIEIETDAGLVGCVHADIPEGMEWHTFKQQLIAEDPRTVKAALWDIRRILAGDGSGVEGVKRVFFGHYEVENGARRLGNCFYIDTGGVRALETKKKPSLRKHFMTVCNVTADARAIVAKPRRTSKMNVVLSCK
ncbi:MAG: metallophosphoesterase [Alphaproteobacteria bacterium]|nr:metallophosphoesterase [Alphaproteobacteria bacterium]